MSDQNSETNYKEVKANAKAEKARAKAMRPWFKKKRFIVPLAIAALAIVSTAANSGSKSDSTANSGSETSTSTETNNSTETKAMAKIGETVTDADFSFVVSKAKCGISKLGSEYVNTKAQGQFCQFNVSVTNNGNDANYFMGTNQKLFSADGKEFSHDDKAVIYADSANTWLDSINPGNTLQGILVFDVPNGVTLDHLELHESAFSSGVEVSVK